MEYRTILISGRRICSRNAVIGSLFFALVEEISININSYLLTKTQGIEFHHELSYDLIDFVIVLLFGIISGFLPARLMGTVLVRWLLADYSNKRLQKWTTAGKGGLTGMVAVWMVCIPILLLEYIFVQFSGHGNFWVFVERTLVATVIAFILGAWSGSSIKTKILDRLESVPVEVIPG